MKKSLLFSLLILQTSLIFAQPTVKKWDKHFGGTGYDSFYYLIQTADGGYLLCGTSNSPISGDKTQDNYDPTYVHIDIWVVKIDSLGNYEWDKTYGGIDDEFFSDVKELPGGGYIIGGYTTSDSTGDVSQHTRGSTDYWMVRIDGVGNLLWDKRFGGSSVDNMRAIDITNDGGFILAGETLCNGDGDHTEPNWGGTTLITFDYWVIKTDSVGNKQWDKRYGSYYDDIGYSIAHTTDGGYVVGGFSRSPIYGDKSQNSQGGWDFWIVKTDSAGNKIWDYDFGGTDSDWMFDMKKTTDGGYVLAGTSVSPISGDKTDSVRGFWDYWMVKIDSAGIKQWDKTFGGSMEEEMNNVVQTKDGGYLLSGESYSPINGEKTESNLGVEQLWMVKTDSAGNKMWDKTFFSSGHDEIGMAIETADGCYMGGVVCDADTGGYKSHSNWSLNVSDYFIVKLCKESGVGIHEPNNAEPVVVFPNPFNDYIKISVTNFRMGNLFLKITDITGREIYHDYFRESDGNWNISIKTPELCAGIYLVTMQTENKTEVIKILKQ